MNKLALLTLVNDINNLERQRTEAIEDAKKQVYNEIAKEINLYRNEELNKLEQEKQKQLEEFKKMEQAIKIYESKIDEETIKELNEIKKIDYNLFKILRSELVKDLSLRQVESYQYKKELQQAKEEFLKDIEKAKQEINKEFDKIIKEEYEKFLQSQEFKDIERKTNEEFDKEKSNTLLFNVMGGKK